MAVDWETCEAKPDCVGVRAGGRSCIAHAGRDDLIAQAVRDGDFRGVPIDAALMRAILELAPIAEAGRPTLTEARFTHAIFTDDADFRGLRFVDDASFRRAEFRAQALFDGAEFDQAYFDGASFGLAASFVQATFNSVAYFRDAAFHGTAELTGLELGAGGDFARALFEDSTRLSCVLTGELGFRDARFKGLLDLAVAGPDARAVRLDEVLCEGQIDARIAATHVSVSRTRLDRGGQIIVERGNIEVEGRLARPTLIAAVVPAAQIPPKLLSLTGSDLSGTTLSGFDMEGTRFGGTHGLDGLRIDGYPMLGRAKGRFWARTGRLAIADEADARGSTRPDPSRRPTSYADVAALYRDLRAGQEGRKDEPGSADFYYGEMEMRRLAAPRRRAERMILATYAVTSGYGLRASRSLGTLAALVIAATIAFQLLLVDDPPRLLRTLLFSLRSTVSFVREPTIDGLTLGGEFVQLGLRFAGPVLLALTALAIRARVRR